MKTKIEKKSNDNQIPENFQKEIEKRDFQKSQEFRNHWTEFVQNVLQGVQFSRWAARQCYYRWNRLFELFSKEQQEKIRFAALDSNCSL